MSESFDEVVLCVVDVETTGLRPTQDRVIEVAVVTATGAGVELDRWSTLVRPDDRPLAGRLEAVTAAPTFSEIAGDMCHRLSGGLVTGHNVRFDLRMLDAELGRLGHRLPKLDFFDTHAAATVLNVDTPNRSLAVLCDELGVPFTQWHTAEGDVDATLGMALKLLARAKAWGRTDVSSLCHLWMGDDIEWPDLERTGVAVRRDVATFPPGGRQPGNRSLSKPSWRRAGTGETASGESRGFSYTIDMSDMIRPAMIKAVYELVDERRPDEDWPDSWDPLWIELADYVTNGGEDSDEAAFLLGTALVNHASLEEEQTPAGQARVDFYRGDFHALEGISRLEAITTTLDGEDDGIAVEAYTLLADLYRRHGGRDQDVVAAFGQGLDAAVRMAAHREAAVVFDSSELLTTELVIAWWEYTSRRRDVQALVGLHDRLLAAQIATSSYADPGRLAADAVRRFAADGEVNVAEEFYGASFDSWIARNRLEDAAASGERLADVLAKAGRVGDAVKACELLWDSGAADQAVANRHSLILEREKRFGDALAVAERGLTLADSSYADALTKRVARCCKRLSQ